MSQSKTGKEVWDSTTALLGNYSCSFGNHWSYNFRNDPKRLGFVLSRYKFSAKMVGTKDHLLELGCSDGIGATLLSEQVLKYVGVDLDQSSIETAKANLEPSKHTVIHDDFMGKSYGIFDAVVSLDVIEHIYPEYINQYYQTIFNNLSSNGLCIIGTPNLTAAAHASQASQLGHVNLYSQNRLVDELKHYFYQVFPFGMNDETMHTGFAAMSHYLLCVACHKKPTI